MKRILIVGPAWVGDMVMAQCLFKQLKQSQPDCQIDVLAPPWSASLLERMPEVSSSIPLPIAHGQLQLRTRYRLAKTLRNRYAQAIVLPNSFKSALIPYWARISQRTGWMGEMRFILNDRRVLDKTKYPLMIERFMALGVPPQSPLPQPYPWPTLRSDQHSQIETLKRFNRPLTAQPILILCPGAEFGPAKQWPDSHFAAVARAKIQDGWQVWILGSSNDQPIADRIMTLTQDTCVNFTGKTSLTEAIDLLSLATSVVTNDSGLMHIACALQKKVIALYGPTSPAFTPPLQTEAHVLSLSLDCQPCFKRECPLQHHHCMKQLSPEAVLHVL